MSKRLVGVLIAMFLVPAFASAEGIEWKGFLTAGYAQSSNMIGTDDGINAFPEFTRLSIFGLTGTTVINNDWDAAIELVARGADDASFRPTVEWALLTWRPISNLSVRLGKQKLGSWLISDYVDIGLLYPWVRPPREVYMLNPFASTIGIGTEYTSPEFLGGRFVADLSYGATDIDYQSSNFKLEGTRDMTAGTAVLAYKHEHGVLRASYSKAYIKSNAIFTNDVVVSPPYPTRVVTVIPFDLNHVEFISVGGKLDFANILLMSEWAKEKTQNSVYLSREGWYATLGYKFFDQKLMPHFTMATLAANQSTLFPGTQKTSTWGLNYSINPSILFKAEYSRITAKDGPGLMDQVVTEPVTVYAASVNAVF